MIDIATFDPTSNDHLRDGYIFDLADFKGRPLNQIIKGQIAFVAANTIQEYRVQENNPKLVILPVEEAEKLVDAWNQKEYIDPPPKQITRAEWWEALECLPPLQWGHRNGIELFCMSEFYTGQITRQYAHVVREGKHYYFTKMVEYNNIATYITPELLTKFEWDVNLAEDKT